MKLPAAILIDLDDTILDDSGCVDACWDEACTLAAGRFGFDADRLRRTISEQSSAWWSAPGRHRRGRLDLRAATAEIVGDALTRLGNDAAPARVISDRYRDIREERATLFAGAVETLEWLRGQGVRLGMMTNGAGPAQRAKIERFALERHFEHILIEGEFGAGKPDPSVFETLLRELGATPATAWAIGDNLAVDVYGAMDAGIHGIWIDARDRGVPVDWREPDRIVSALTDLRSA